MVGLSTVFLFIAVSVQGICVPERLSIGRLSGIVVFASSEQPVAARATVELRADKYESKLLASTVADNKGRFDLGKQRSGNYQVEVIAEHGVTRFSFPVRYKFKKQSRDQLLIALGLDFQRGACHGSFATYGKQRTN